jgi:NitT/TauT family transport system ATP-binding protein
MTSVALGIANVTKRFALGRGRSLLALDDVSIEVEAGTTVAVVGPSGCGKTSLLRMLAGLDEPTSGQVTSDGRPVAALRAEHAIGMAPQDASLLPWLSAAGNIALPFRAAGRPVDRARVEELLTLVGLAEYGKLRPRQMSGGMRQRVSIARAIALRPSLLLLDEPFASVDAVTRRRLGGELGRILEAGASTAVLITHSVEEAVSLAHKIIVLGPQPGRVVHVEHVKAERRDGLAIRDTPVYHETVDRLLDTLDETAPARPDSEPTP